MDSSRPQPFNSSLMEGRAIAFVEVKGVVGITLMELKHIVVSRDFRHNRGKFNSYQFFVSADNGFNPRAEFI